MKDYIVVIVVAALAFGVCFLIDKGFQKLFRSQAAHQSGLAVRLNKKYGAFGLIMVVLGLAAIFAGVGSEHKTWVLVAGGALIIVTGVFLVVYYMSHGIFYDQDSFVYSTFGKRNKTYRYDQIKAQQLYNNQGHTLIELYMTDGKAVQVQTGMTGAYAFMDHAYNAWLRQTGRSHDSCTFYDPDNSCWFPPVEE